MLLRVLDLDNSVIRQTGLLERFCPEIYQMPFWGPRLRLACRFNRFQQFEQALDQILPADSPSEPALTWYGSGDFHHVSLALVRRLWGPFNLLVLDNHPDWMRGVPFLHCGTWLYHAARLPQVQQVFHVGGDVDFDNSFCRLAPWGLLRSGKVVVFPGRRTFGRGPWNQLPHEPLRSYSEGRVTRRRLHGLLEAHRPALEQYPLYISLDKDVLLAEEAAVNWDSGHLTLAELEIILRAFLEAAAGNLAGMDIVGDWSPVMTSGIFRRFLHWTEHPRLEVDADDARVRNERTNLKIMDILSRILPEIPVGALVH